MPQFARPDADLVDGNWTKGSGGNTNMFAEIDESVASDADYVQSELAPSSSAFAVRLSDIEDPQSSTGHVVRFRYQKDASGGAQINLTVQLRQGYVNESTLGTLIAATTINDIPNGFTNGTINLSGAEADAITDYNDLALRFVATQA